MAANKKIDTPRCTIGQRPANSLSNGCQKDGRTTSSSQGVLQKWEMADPVVLQILGSVRLCSTTPDCRAGSRSYRSLVCRMSPASPSRSRHDQILRNQVDDIFRPFNATFLNRRFAIRLDDCSLRHTGIIGCACPKGTHRYDQEAKSLLQRDLGAKQR